ncbi:MAG TPA: EamA family transporter RarD [Gordonia sp. (in: high G+C Gram-positive bacteria)]|uniref:EamA family transporter RarD n=1 Tax=unclassified Gordonia (in: high G+C Gram-positive bacteria) TaxID=2657482 RepID=UPI000F9AE657|nr:MULTISPECIES: EamA family transporter RarD [unclassified Gordonia (in: high G+C Gram-positive bacteria)]RUP35694.1 MAG: EamA family transporter RarD [Gordonia sp. (in: high G+C Gram-positive bacteria)]HNP59019.1 EamA family transporter RarD [Gordonia sp. (in: high G+C Gram-positive bacteria)]HRC52701.1 EamA family transporter RarD [Gordonia sp. (in: high G+C Gram-positive bacteria)]
MSGPRSGVGTGIGYGIAAYALWGAFPLYFVLLDGVPPIEIVAHRVLWSLVVCLVAVALTRQWRQVWSAATWRVGGLLALGAVFLAANWGIYVYSVSVGEVNQASLGYFINPLVTVLLAVGVLHERLRRAQWVALGLGGLAVLVLTLGYGGLPWISLSLAITFGLYGLIKKTVGESVSALTGLTVETVALAPAAAVFVVWLQARGEGHFLSEGADITTLLILCGAITVVPLLFFAAAARRVPLSILGLLQYLTPVLQLLIAVVVLGEHMPAVRWMGFGLVWLALGVLTVDSLRAVRAAHVSGSQR